MTPNIDRLGNYELLEKIGQGGMGTVYRAVHTSLGRTVAIKVLRRSLTTSEEWVQRFLREARAAAALEHPNIVSAYDVGEDESGYFFVMNYVPGPTLEEVLRTRGGALPWREAAAHGRALASALDHAHSRGIVHRDVKPGNVIVRESGQPVLTDFGIAWAASETRLTQLGASLGSVHYMAPELLQGSPFDQRADLYSLGVVLYQLLTGATPFAEGTPATIFYRQLNEPVAPPSQVLSGIPASLDEICCRLLARDPEKRHRSAADLEADLSAVLEGRAARTSRPLEKAWSEVAARGTAAASPAAPETGSPQVAPGGRSGSGSRGLHLIGAALALAGLAGVTGLYLYYEAENRPLSGGGSFEAAGAGTAPSGPVDAMRAPELPESSLAIAAGTDDAVAVEPSAPEAAAATESWTITSAPAGATVWLDGDEMASGTPVTVDLEVDERHRLRLEREGRIPFEWAFELESLSASQRSARTLHFPLEPAAPPRPRGTLVATPRYPLVVDVAGKRTRIAAGERGRIAVGPGRHEVELISQAVFLRRRESVTLRADEERALALPETAVVRFAAVPERCRLTIDGWDAGDLPLDVELVVGAHELSYWWPGSGERLEQTKRIDRGTRILIAAPPER